MDIAKLEAALVKIYEKRGADLKITVKEKEKMLFNIIEKSGKVYVRDHERKIVIRFNSLSEAIRYIEERRGR